MSLYIYNVQFKVVYDNIFEIVLVLSRKVLVENSNNPLANIFELNQLKGGGFVLMPYPCVGPWP